MNLDEDIEGDELALFFRGFLEDNDRVEIAKFCKRFKDAPIQQKRRFCKLVLRIADENRNVAVITQQNDDVTNFLTHIWVVGKAIDKTWRE